LTFHVPETILEFSDFRPERAFVFVDRSQLFSVPETILDLADFRHPHRVSGV
jgi:hypothetical protein